MRRWWATDRSYAPVLKQYCVRAQGKFTRARPKLPDVDINYQILVTAITPANGISEDDIRPHLYEANVRSSFSTDSTIELRLKMKAKKNIWRNDDQARAMAMAMHSIG